MIVVDSSVWIEWLAGSDLAGVLNDLFPSANQCIVPTLVQFEVVKWLRRGADEDRADAFLAYSLECQVAPLTTDIALTAAALSVWHKLAMADAIVLATAREADASLLTCDAHFKDIEGVQYISKTDNAL